jgi:hypothetical protein
MFQVLYIVVIMNIFKRINALIVLSVFLLSSCTLASLEQDLSISPLVDQRVKSIISHSNKMWTSMSILMIENNIDKLMQWFVDKYNSQWVITALPKTEQEKMTSSLWLLYQYLCLNKSLVIERFDEDIFYKPDITSPELQTKMWWCYQNDNLLYQEAIRYYVLPDIGTLETVHIPLAKRLWYGLSGFDSYLRGDLLDMGSEKFFFEEYARANIIPLMDLSNSELWLKRKDKFDMMKIVAYVETTDYPFFDDKIIIAILAKKWDNYIKITTPYEKIRYPELWNIITIAKDLFYRSVEDGIKDKIVSNMNFDTYYYTSIQELVITDSLMQKNKVRQYLAVLRENDASPQWYVDFIAQSLKKDSKLIYLLESKLETLSPFFD